MMEMDLEDFIEEVKFQMTEFEALDEKTIKDWEKKARKWVDTHDDRKRIIKHRDEILVKITDEEACIDVAEKFYKAYKNDKIKEYWYKFTII